MVLTQNLACKELLFFRRLLFSKQNPRPRQPCSAMMTQAARLPFLGLPSLQFYVQVLSIWEHLERRVVKKSRAMFPNEMPGLVKCSSVCQGCHRTGLPSPPSSPPPPPQPQLSMQIWKRGLCPLVQLDSLRFDCLIRSSSLSFTATLPSLHSKKPLHPISMQKD